MTSIPGVTAPRRDSVGTRRLSGGVFATDALALALTSSADAAMLVEVRSEGPIVTWSNESARTLFAQPLVDRPPLASLLAPAGDEIAVRRLLGVFAAGDTTRTECAFTRTDGVRWGDWALAPIISDEDAPRWLVTVRDTTDRRRRDQALEIYLRETEQAKLDALDKAQQAEALVNELTVARGQAQEVMQQRSAFLASVSHEIRTPLNGVIGMTGVLLSTQLTGEQHEIAQAVRSSAERLLGLLNDVLDFAKMDSGRMQLESVEFDVHETIEQIVELLAVRPGAGRLRVNTLIGPGVPTIMVGDPGRFGQVLSNLVGNAVKFTPEGQVTVRASVDAMDDTHVILRVEVSDSGIGIETDAQHRLFEPFVQADASTTRRYGGSGLGLAICKELVHLMGGSIGVRSTPGAGSTFWFTTRLAVSMGAPVRASTEQAALFGDRALVVDPRAEDRAIFALQLGGCGLSSLGVASLVDAREAVATAARDGVPFDLIIVHHDCPDAEPLHAAKVLHGDATALGMTPVLFVMAPLGASPPQAALDAAGGVGLLHTPVRPSQLASQLAAGLRRQRPEAVEEEASLAPADDDLTPRWKLAPRVLVAEDNVINQQVAQHLLQLLGCRVEVVANGFEALDALAHVPYDLVFMDCQMPECDGYEATRRLRRAGNRQASVPVIAMTANVMPGDRQRCLDAGMDDYVAKPVHADEIDAVLRRWLAQHLATDADTVFLSQPEPVVASTSAAPTPHAPSVPDTPGAVVDDKIIASLKSMQARGARKTLVAELLQAFCAQADEIAAEVRSVVDSGDAERIRLVAHKFKGACGSIGAAGLASLAKELEYTAREFRLGDAPDAAEALLTNIPFGITALRAAYADVLGDAGKQGGTQG